MPPLTLPVSPTDPGSPVRGPSAAASPANTLNQVFFFLFAMATMLAAARFIMPTIVEETRYAWYRGELRAQYEASGDGLANVSLGALSEAYQMVTQHVGPSVVHIEVQRDADANRRLRDRAGLRRLFLHAASLEFSLDGGRIPYVLNAPLAPELADALDRLA